MFTYGVTFNAEDLLEVLILRGVLACGGHVAWGAVTGAATIIAKGRQALDGQVFKKPAFLTFFTFNIILHGIWDMESIYLPVIVKYALLCAAVWILIVICLNRGLAEINAISEQDTE